MTPLLKVTNNLLLAQAVVLRRLETALLLAIIHLFPRLPSAGCTCTPPFFQKITALGQPRNRYASEPHLWPTAHILHTPYSHLSTDPNNNYYHYEDSTHKEDVFAAPANGDAQIQGSSPVYETRYADYYSGELIDNDLALDSSSLHENSSYEDEFPNSDDPASDLDNFCVKREDETQPQFTDLGYESLVYPTSYADEVFCGLAPNFPDSAVPEDNHFEGDPREVTSGIACMESVFSCRRYSHEGIRISFRRPSLAPAPCQPMVQGQELGCPPSPSATRIDRVTLVPLPAHPTCEPPDEDVAASTNSGEYTSEDTVTGSPRSSDFHMGTPFSVLTCRKPPPPLLSPALSIHRTPAGAPDWDTATGFVTVQRRRR